MPKFVIKNCFHLMNSVYADGRETYNECGDSLTDEKCVDRDDCFLKKIANNLMEVVKDPTCNRCDGVGYENGCADTSCGTYEAYKCIELLDIEFEKEK